MSKRAMVTVMMCITIFLILLCGPRDSSSKEWPNSSITMIVPWGAGGATDLISRMLAETLHKSLGVPVIVENKTGAAGLLGLGVLAKAKPDGYTVSFMSCTAITEKPFLKKVPFDPIKGFSYICQVFNYSYGFAVKADAPWKTFQEFVEAAKKQPGKLTVSTSGIGSTMHVALAKLEDRIPGFKVKVVPYQKSTDVVLAAMGGHVNACFQTQEWAPYVASGQLRLLAAPQKERLPDYPSVPTWLDLGYGVYARSQGAYVAPAGLPESIRDRLEREFKKAMDSPGFKDLIKKYSMTEFYKPGRELYEELMAMYEENKAFIPKLGIVEE